ncbi:MAG TPA: hypothetical protein VH325_08210 [Bryobacteraceae bacterium]|jgi:hypothetical protein|nr:hypothetical protein [Bryobacteraceae bacterium]
MEHAFTRSLDSTIEDGTCTLLKTIAAIQTTARLADPTQLGLITRLPCRVKLTLLGKGFNDRTVKVHCQDAIYFVFLEDLDEDTQKAWAATMLCLGV